ncbi:MAG: DNA repair protein RecO [Bacteroidota bacterium]|nr:DNA repair protein RecO [Bacteroidota bacterium]
MLAKTSGIVLRNTKYAESSVISKIYTRQFGIQTYIINSVRSPKAAIKPSLLMPLSLLEMVVYHNTTKDIQRIKEAKNNPVLHRLHFDVVRSAIALYTAELIYKSVKEEEANEELYTFLEHFIQRLDDEHTPLTLMPLYITVELTRHLGFYPHGNYSAANPVFILAAGEFAESPAHGGNNIEEPHSRYLHTLLGHSLSDLDTLHIPKAARNHLLHRMQDYYMLHLPNFQPLKSLGVLMQVNE